MGSFLEQKKIKDGKEKILKSHSREQVAVFFARKIHVYG